MSKQLIAPKPTSHRQQRTRAMKKTHDIRIGTHATAFGTLLISALASLFMECFSGEWSILTHEFVDRCASKHAGLQLWASVTYSANTAPAVPHETTIA